MRDLDDILFGFLSFFLADRVVRLFSAAVVVPWAERRTGDKNHVESWKLFAELSLLMSALFLVWRYRKVLHCVCRT
jgi:hypothetical protein